MEEAKKLLGSVAISSKIIGEIDAQVKDITGFKNKIQEYIFQEWTPIISILPT